MTNETRETSKDLLNHAAILAALVTILVIGLRTVANNEVWTHLATGRAIVEHGIRHADTMTWSQAGKPWVNTTWMYDWFLYRVWQLGGAPLAVLLHVASVIGAFILLLPLARRWATPPAAAIAMILCGWILAPAFTLSPTTFTLVFSALFIMLFTSRLPPAKAVPILLVAQVLWTNLSPTFLWGPVICLIFLAQHYFSGGRKGKMLVASMRLPSLLMLTGADVLVTLLNPYLLGLHTSILTSLTNPAVPFLMVWISPFSDQFAPSILRYLPIFALIVAAGGLVMQKEKLPIGMTTLAILTAFLVIRSIVFSAFFAILAFPFLAMSVHAILDALTERQNKPILSARVIGAAVILLALVTSVFFITNAYYNRYGYACGFGVGVASNAFPSEKAVETLASPGLPTATLNTIQDGGFLAWKLPQRTIFADSRLDLYPSDFYQEIASALNGSNWKDFSEKWKPESVVLNTTYRQAPITAKLLAANRWSLIYFDGLTALYLPRTEANRGLIENQELKRAGLSLLSDRINEYRGKLGHTFAQPPPPDLIGAGALLLANGNFKQAAGIYSILTRGLPRMATAWLNLGQCRLELGEPDKAVEALEQAVRLAPKNSLAWLNLGLAFEKLERPDEATKAFAQVKELNPQLAEAFWKQREADRKESETIKNL